MDSIFYRLSLSNMYIFWKRKYISKVQLFWEDHKNVRNRHYGFEIYLIKCQNHADNCANFCAFSEKLNRDKIFECDLMIW